MRGFLFLVTCHCLLVTLMNNGWSQAIVPILLLVAVLFGLAILLFIVFFIRGDQRNKRACPQCAELIQADANICRYCGEKLTRQA